jgi:hypothetical protein
MPSRKSPEERAATDAAKAASMSAIKSRMPNAEIENVNDDLFGDDTVSSAPVVSEQFVENTTPTPEPVKEPVQSNAELAKENYQPEHSYGKNYYAIDNSTLPSRGIYYKNTIYLRNFSVIEIKRLATVTEDSAEEIINEIMGRIVKGVQYDKLLSVDKTAILFYIRTNTFPDPDFKINFECVNKVDKKDEYGNYVINEETKERVKVTCGAEGKLHFTGADLTIKRFDDDFDPINDLKIAMENGDVITWRFPIVQDEKDLEGAIEDAITALKEAGIEDYDIDKDILNQCYLTTSINNRQLSLPEVFLYITQMATPRDFIKFVKEVNNKFDIGVDTMIKTKCEKCGGSVSVPVIFSPEFFFPEYNPQ